VERHTGQDMGWFFDQWVYGSDLPTYRASYKVSSAPDGKYVLTLRVRQQGVPDNFLAYMPVTIELGKDQVVRIRMKVTGPVSELELPLLPAKPKSVKFNDLDGVLADVKSVGWEG
jgi:aminopeptidase N